MFVVPGASKGKGRARSTASGHHYTPAQTRNAEAFVKMLAAQEMKGAAPETGAIDLRIIITVDVPKSFNKAKKAAALLGLLRPTVKPDVDNAVKLIGDALNGVVYVDDKQIVELTVRKNYGPVAYTRVTVLSIDGVA